MSHLSIETLIRNLGFYGEKNLIYANDVASCSASKQDIRVMESLKPFAVYLLDNKPFVLFISSSDAGNDFKALSKSIWNAQIPVVFYSEENSVKIYNGRSIEFKTGVLHKIHEKGLGEVADDDPFSFLEISDPLFWAGYEKEYATISLSQHLLRNITEITNILKKQYKIGFATKLVLRLIFVRYLIDRGIDFGFDGFDSNVSQSQQSLLKVCRNKDQLYGLFQHLKNKFNGNLFELDVEADDLMLKPVVFELLSDFLAGDIDLGSGQMSLFPMYNFKIIPIDLISNIYEILLGKEVRESDNAFYTPNYLAEYILDRVALEHIKAKKQGKILDPSCGSGIFLANAYRRIIDANIGKSLVCPDDDLLRRLLEQNIFGVDINQEAIDVSIFSLYVTMLDYKDSKSLVGFKFPNLKGTNLVVADFFDDDAVKPLQNVEFDFIIGNPPWGMVPNGLHISYCKEQGHLERQQNSEICRSFVFRAKDFSNEHTVCSFILHSKILYTQKKPSQLFRQYLLKETRIIEVVEMSSVRNLVFKDANAPSAIVSFQYNKNQIQNKNNRISYTSLKPNAYFKLFNVIASEKYDVKYVPQSILLQYDWAWKTIVYGGCADIEIIARLKTKFQSLKTALQRQEPKLIMGAGIQENDGDMKSSAHLCGKKILDSNNSIAHFGVNHANSKVFQKERIHRPRNEELFNPPYCINTKGVNCSNFKMKAAYSEESFICRESLYVIKADESQKEILYTVTGLLNSSLYSYLNLMLGSSIGIEREQRFMEEVFDFPYIESTRIANQSENISTLVKNKVYNLLSGSLVPCLEYDIQKLDDIILEEFGLKEDVFIDYALNVQIPELTNQADADIYRPVIQDDLTTYTKCFIDEFTRCFHQQGKGILTKFYLVSKKYVAFELIVSDEVATNEEYEIQAATDSDMELFTKIMKHEYNEMFWQIKNIIHFTENSFYIIKPNQYKYWHPAIAQMDLGEILDQILKKP